MLCRWRLCGCKRRLINDEISEKKAGLLLYSLQMASSNLKNTTFTDSKKEVVTEMVESPTAMIGRTASSRVIAGIGKTSPLINTDDTDQKRLPELPELKSKTKTKTKTFTTEDMKEHGGTGQGNGGAQPGAAVPHEHRLGSEL